MYKNWPLLSLALNLFLTKLIHLHIIADMKIVVDELLAVVILGNFEKSERFIY